MSDVMSVLKEHGDQTVYELINDLMVKADSYKLTVTKSPSNNTVITINLKANVLNEHDDISTISINMIA